jgi:hypothetical protein
MAALIMSLSADNIIDAEFETVLVAKRAAPVAVPEAAEFSPANDLSLLRGHAQTKENAPEQLTPAFLFFTLIAASVVFWVSGGHALLY